MMASAPVPADFNEQFVRLGRLQCEAHYRVGRTVISAWLRRSGKQRLLHARTAFVAAQGKGSPKGPATRPKLTRKDVGKILAKSFPVKDRRRVSPTLARHAAQHLRVVRNGGFIVSPTNEGDWRVGTRRVSAAQLVDLAIARGFDPNLTRDFGDR